MEPTSFRLTTLLQACASILGAVCLIGIGVTRDHTAASMPPTPPQDAPRYRIYLPLVLTPDRFPQSQAIWPHGNSPAPHEVALFRRSFSLPKPVRGATLRIFADTRYEVWVDGRWVGRGPARFSRTHREYDVYTLEELSSGDHLLAVLVQWAPNTRRSESLTPYLKARLEISDAVVQTDSSWKAILADAWRQDAVPVHSWNLIGPTELLDLRRLPSNWRMPGYPDGEWPTAVVKSEPRCTYTPRSIPLLENTPFIPTLLDAGLLSPGRRIGEVPAGTSSLTFSVAAPLHFTVEMLADPDAPPTTTLLLDGSSLLWTPVSLSRPDTLAAHRDLGPGVHTLSFLNVPATGATLALPDVDIQYPGLPFQWGPHAGRRSLLAEPVSRPGVVTVTTGGEGIDLFFGQSPAYAVLDLGRVVHGRVSAEVVGPAGAILDIGWDERLWQGRRPLPYPGSLHRQWNQVDSWVLDGSTRSISTLDTRAGRYLWVAVWRAEPLQVRNLRVLEERYPVMQRGTFVSHDPLLNQIWQVGVESLYPNMTDAYTDTPWRERGQWWGDAYVEFQVNRVAFGDITLLRRGLLLMAEAFENGEPEAMAPNGEDIRMLDYGMLWVQALREYWQLAGDRTTVFQVYTPLQEFLTFLQGYEHPDTGLLDVPIEHWSRTALVDWPAGHSRYGQSAALNALYYRTLVDASVLAEAVEDEEWAEIYRQRADRVRESLNRHLYLDSHQRYASSRLGGALVPPSPHAQAWPLAYGVVPEEKEQAVASSLLELLSPDPSRPNVEIYGMYWLLQALGENNRVPEALSLIRRYYGRLVDLGATTWWEGFNAHHWYAASLSHGWGGAPTWFLTTYVLGARQVGPEQWEVRPALVGVESVSGTLPFGTGVLAVAWTRQGCDHASLTVVAPPGAAGEIVIPPVNSTAAITLNGTLIWESGIPQAENVFGDSDGVHILPLPGGMYSVEIHHQCRSLYLPVVYALADGQSE
ncbi:MAG: alpha-L-rhamnosidase [Anaerolineae bacterium]|nr:alpha-L-rhamnosidase [Anaerolineae bacterium]